MSWWESVPDDVSVTMSGARLKATCRTAADRKGGGPEWVTTTEAAAVVGRSRKWWERIAPSIPGAFQEKVGGPWLLPLAACRMRIESASRRASNDFARGPRKTA